MFDRSPKPKVASPAAVRSASAERPVRPVDRFDAIPTPLAHPDPPPTWHAHSPGLQGSSKPEWMAAPRVAEGEGPLRSAEPLQRLRASAELARPDSRTAALDAAMRMPNRTGLPDRLKADMEAGSGLPMDDVRVHLNSPKPARVRARAYAQGTDIHLGPGQERHLPHEAWHVVQQAQGRVRATTRIGGIGVNTEPALEREADRMAARPPAIPVEMRAAARAAAFSGSAPVVQRMAAWLLEFNSVVYAAFGQRFEDLKPRLLHIVEAAAEAAIQDDDDELEVALELLGLLCDVVLEDGYLGGSVEALSQFRQALAKLQDIPSADLAALEQATDRYITAFRAAIGGDLLNAKTYVESSKKRLLKSSNPDIKGAAQSLLRPSSQAYYLNIDSYTPVAPISHGEQNKASVYSRSAKHPSYKGMKGDKVKALADMTVRNTPGPSLRKSGKAAHLGLYPNLMTFHRNQLSRPSDPDQLEEPDETSGGDGELYDRALEYRLALCRQVVQRSGQLSKLRVLVANDYPLVMVRFDLAKFMGEYSKTPEKVSSGTAKAFTSFLMNYFIGVVNFYARDAGLNITMVERSSFGFLTPSIAETGESFRINTGLMPPTYARVLAQALKKLDAELSHLAIEGQPMSGPLPKLTDEIYRSYLEKDGEAEASDDEEEQQESPTESAQGDKVSKLGKLSDFMNLALFPIEKRSKTTIANAVRNRASLDFVNASAFNALGDQKPFALGETLARLLSGLQVEKNTLKTKAPDAAAYGNVATRATPRGFDRSTEVQFTDLLAFLRLRLLKLAQDADAQKSIGGRDLAQRLLGIVPLIYGDSPHLEIALELVNELILLYSIKTAERQGTLDDGYGSDSDEEDAPDDELRRPLRAKKIITHNGMRALIASMLASQTVVFPKQAKSTSSRKMTVFLGDAYYEMSDALKLSKTDVSLVKTPAADVLVTDINACVTGEEVPDATEQLTSTAYTVWIIDTTSATQAQSAAVVEAFRRSPAKLLYLVSSGFKMEQLGADRNQYGTIRAFADNDEKGETQLGSVFAAIRTSDKPLAAVSHVYRRIMKSLGAIPRNRNLLRAISTPGSRTDDDVQSDFESDEEPSEERQQYMLKEKLFGAFVAALHDEDITPDHAAEATGGSNDDHARNYIYTAANADEDKLAHRSWFEITPNNGAGDCALYALEGKDLSFQEVIDLREQLADTLPDTDGGKISGSVVYQTLEQSQFLSEDLHNAMQNRHQVSLDVMRSLVRVPGAYAGDLEIQAFCQLAGVDVWVVTRSGELRRFSSDRRRTIMTVADDTKMALLGEVGQLLEQDEIVLYQSENHFERITDVNLWD